ncbi:hypothetical protein BC939DRAFT_504993 [Gamsiella multidivaricata]|uniref:uncharacterized protein n=1 Tax=Gamsiella multidivaricata TaxID=101098 RepID=UPI00221FA7FD|nr:uncharacterized protein BC939DRAFT_504993 [Gamsiella multidivaricata]KAI7820575.1 hypothetical protein BC939DRAFT_504993 [Gamsiella multidivaricata]
MEDAPAVVAARVGLAPYVAPTAESAITVGKRHHRSLSGSDGSSGSMAPAKMDKEQAIAQLQRELKVASERVESAENTARGHLAEVNRVLEHKRIILWVKSQVESLRAKGARVILISDFNGVVNPSMDRWSGDYTSTVPELPLFSWLDTRSFTDTFRLLYPTQPSFTFRGVSRLDMAWISSDLTSYLLDVKTNDLVAPIRSDQALVAANFDLHKLVNPTPQHLEEYGLTEILNGDPESTLATPALLATVPSTQSGTAFTPSLQAKVSDLGYIIRSVRRVSIDQPATHDTLKLLTRKEIYKCSSRVFGYTSTDDHQRPHRSPRHQFRDAHTTNHPQYPGHILWSCTVGSLVVENDGDGLYVTDDPTDIKQRFPRGDIDASWYEALMDTPSRDEVAAAIQSAPTNKAPGISGLTGDLLQHLGPVALSVFVLLVQACIAQGTLPTVRLNGPSTASRKVRHGLARSVKFGR